MDISGVTKFRDLQKMDRYKKLQLNLKLSNFQSDLGKSENVYSTSPTWPSLSTINTDALDTTSTNVSPSLQVSRVESEVVSSSNNLRKILMHKNRLPMVPMATSSIKKYPVNDFDNDRAIMPPPSTTAFYEKKMSRGELKHSVQEQQNKIREINESYDSAMKISSDASCSDFLESKNNQDSGEKRIFSRWRVLINDQRQLIIKGTLQCGKIARSKPVIQRFSNNKVQSIYQHIYYLDGNIDDRDELPDYVRGKFHNGFPDDWENVFQLWKNYIDQGCPENFRWPTRITDSDDDITSEISDFTYLKTKQNQCQTHLQSSESISNNNSLGYHSKTYSDSNHNLEKSKEENHEHIVSINQNVKRLNNSGNSEAKNASACNDESNHDNNSKETSLNVTNNSNPNLKGTSYLSEIIKEDKLRIILSNLGNEKCSPQYLDKFIELIDCLRFILSYTPNNNLEVDMKKQNSSLSNQNSGYQKFNNTVSLLENQNVNLDQSKSESSKLEEKKCEHLKQVDNLQINNLIQDNDKENAIETSDSETYMGIPNVSLNRLIKSKPSRSECYRDRKNRNKGRVNANRNKLTEEQMINDQNNQDHKNSSLSFSEGEHEENHQKNRNEQVLESKEENARYHVKNNNLPNEDENECKQIRRSKDSYKVTQQQKPVVKSNSIVNYNLKRRNFKNQIPTHSDVSIIDAEVTKKKNIKTSKSNINNKNMNQDEERFSDELLKHPFLTYDSEDFENEEEIPKKIQSLSNKSNNIEKNNSEYSEHRKYENSQMLQQEKYNKFAKEQHSESNQLKKVPSLNIASASSSYGSKENPKLLTSWSPVVMYEDDLRKKCNLSFEGKLLNEAGHVVYRKYITDPVLRRHSSKLIETVKNEYFKLDGDINATKHVIPKDLLKQCRSGCPSKIKDFCEEWRRLKPVLEKPDSNKLENLHNISIDHISIPTSSTGRKIVPPLDYWKGERLVTKSNVIVYKSGDLEKVASAAITRSLSDQRPMNNKSTQDLHVRISKTNVRHSKPRERSASPIPKNKSPKKRVVQQLHYSSNSTSEEDTPVKKSLRISKGLTNTKPDKLERETNEILTESAYNTKTRKNQNINKNTFEVKRQTNSSRILTRQTTKKGLEWSYEQIYQHQDILSEDDISVVVRK